MLIKLNESSEYIESPNVNDLLNVELSQLLNRVRILLTEQKKHEAIKGAFLNAVNQLVNEKNTSDFRIYTVIPGKIYAGEIPSSVDDNLLEYKIKKLNELGVTRIINLTEPNEKNFKGITLRSYEEKLPEHIQMHRFSIKDLDIPSIEFMKKILQTIKFYIEREEVIYIHCWGGIGRTGTVVGCLMIENEILFPENAIGLIKFLKRNTDIRERNSPETFAQKEFIENWKCN